LDINCAATLLVASWGISSADRVGAWYKIKKIGRNFSKSICRIFQPILYFVTMGIMKRKRPSPTVSEADFDISGAIVGPQDGNIAERARKPKPQKQVYQDDSLFDLDEAGDDSDGDDAFIAATQAASNRKAGNLKGRTVKKGGGFQAMGLSAATLKAIARKGFSVPTPIQRKTVPLILDRQDVVGMARTGSGKTAAFVIPMVERLKTHSAKIGSRAIIMSPSRELALQTLKVVKELGKGTDLRAILLVGGESLDDQFRALTSNPDIIIATPGRFHHLKVEMNLDLSSVQYVVFDEADRLFEMGFAVQLTEILHALPANRQTLLFSATLPKSLVEFARAGLQEPKLVRLDAESKVSPDLESAFFTVKSSEKDGALLQIIQDVIKIPILAENVEWEPEDGRYDEFKKKRSQMSKAANNNSPSQHSTIVFAATKHHVEYVTTLLRQVGYQVSYVYGSLDQTARKMSVDAFREGRTNILVVTDVAARGIDIPVIANVLNYDFPSQPKIFVHRVGRTARAGRKGWSFSLVQHTDLPYLIDLQLFLSRRLVLGQPENGETNFAQDVVVGTLPRDRLGSNCEWATKLVDENPDLSNLQSVAAKGERLYIKSRNAASIESVKRSKEILELGSSLGLNALFSGQVDQEGTTRMDDMLARVRNYRPHETIFEIGKRGVTGDETVELLQKQRRRIDAKKSPAATNTRRSLLVPMDTSVPSVTGLPASPGADEDDESGNIIDNDVDMDDASEDELVVTFSHGQKSQRSSGNNPWEEAEHFLSYTPQMSNVAEEKGYGVHSGSSSNIRGGSDFLAQARNVTVDLIDDELSGFGQANQSRMRWDKQHKKYVSRANDEDGSRGAKMIRGESGLKIPASMRSGRFDEWRKTNRLGKMPRVGEDEKGNHTMPARFNRRFKQHKDQAPKMPDKFRDNYFKQKQKVVRAKERMGDKWKDGAKKSELRSIDDVRKGRNLKEKRREKHGRPSRNQRT
jgi:ATP-dependent RNA helicase DDX54/DBP10